MSSWQLYALVAVLSLLGGGYGTGLYYRIQIDHIQEAHDKALIDAQNQVILKERESAKITAEASRDYQNRIAQLSKRYADWVHTDAKTRNNLSTISESSGGHNGSPSSSGLSWNSPEIIHLMYSADEQTQRLIACQTWIRSQSNN